jgi:hypothetical protein
VTANLDHYRSREETAGEVISMFKTTPTWSILYGTLGMDTDGPLGTT